MSQELNHGLVSPEEIVLIGAGVAVAGGAVLIGSQVVAGVFVGAVTAAGVTYTICKTRTHLPRVWNVIHGNPLAADVVIDTGVFLLVGGVTVTGIVAGASASLFTSIGLIGLRRLGKIEVSKRDLRFLKRLTKLNPVIVKPV
jgi:hypothetical protein